MLGNPYVLLDAPELVSQTVETLSMSVECHPFNTGNYSYTFEDWSQRHILGVFKDVFQTTLCGSPDHSLTEPDS